MKNTTIMKKEEKIICDFMHDFVDTHWDNIDKEKCQLFETKKVFLEKVKTNVQDAMWVLVEVCDWSADEKYLKELFIHVDNSFSVLKIGEDYIKAEFDWLNHNYTLSFTEQKTKTVTYFE